MQNIIKIQSFQTFSIIIHCLAEYVRYSLFTCFYKNDTINKKGDNMDVDKKLIGIRIMQKRKELGLNQEDLAERIGISKNHLSNIERGINVPTTSCVLKLCDVLGGTPDYYLIGRIEQQTGDEIISLITKCPPDKHKFVKDFLLLFLNNI